MVPVDLVPVIGIVGGVGSGKSAVARQLALQLPVHVIDADQIGHATLKQPEVIQALQQEFGSAVLDADGQISRARLAARVFGNEGSHRQARGRLEAIVHPQIGKAIRAEIAEVREAAEVSAILLDAAVLLESGWAAECDRIVFVDAPAAVRAERVRARGWDDQEILRREASQMPLDEKRSRADIVIDNSGSLDQAVDQLSRLLTG